MAAFCPKCGAPGGPEDRFCGSCGSSIVAGDQPAAAAASPLVVPDPVAPAATPPQPAAQPPGMVERVERIYRQVGDFLRAGGVKFMEDAGAKSYTALYGSAAVLVRVTPAGDDDTWVSFLAPVVTGARLDQELLEYLLHKNADYAATKFHLSSSGEIWLQYSVFGSILDANTCKIAVVFLMMTADTEDDAIRAKWGGRRAAELMLGTSG